MESPSPGPVQPKPKRRPSLLIGNQNSPSLAFLHKPARSNSGNDSKEYRKLMEENTRKNKMQHSDNSAILSPSVSSATDTEILSPSHSPLSMPLVRKKSGEFVRSSLKSHSRSLSLPSTPSYKQVHFGGDNLETEVKYFDEKDTPQTISGNNSPLETGRGLRDYFSAKGDIDDLYSDYDESAIDDDDDVTSSKESVISDDSYNTKLLLRGEWKLTLLNFPDLSYSSKFRQKAEVFLERIFISDNKENLHGHIAVHNVDFSKRVVVRYSLDGWKSVTEIDCHYVTNATSKLRRNNYDRFEFEIPLVTLFHNTEETVEMTYTDVFSRFALCVRYNVLGKEFWENNNFSNFNLILHKITPNKKDTHRVDTRYPKGQKHSSRFLAKRNETQKSTSPIEDLEQQRFVPAQGSQTPGQAMLDHFIDLTSQDLYSPDSPDLSRMSHTPYSPIELNPKNGVVTNIDPIDLNIASPKSPLSPILSPNTLGSMPEMQIPGVGTRSARLLSIDRPPVSSSEYQELLDKYCFFGGGASSSSNLPESAQTEGAERLRNSQQDDSLIRPTYFLGNNAGFFNDNNFGHISTFDGNNLGFPQSSSRAHPSNNNNNNNSEVEEGSYFPSTAATGNQSNSDSNRSPTANHNNKNVQHSRYFN